MRIVVLSRNPSLYSTSRLVLAGRALGHDVDVVDPLELQLVVAPRRAKLRRPHGGLPRYDTVLPRIGASITSYGIAVLRQFEKRGSLLLNGPEAIQTTRDKVRTLQVLGANGIRVPRTVCMRSLDGLDSALDLVGGCPVIVKLQQGTQGVGTILTDTRQAFYSLVETLWAMGQEIVVQEYVRECQGRDIRALVLGDQVVAAMRRTAPPGEFRANLHRGGTGEALKLSRRFRACAVKAASLVQLDVAGVDLLEGKKGPIVLEINSSPGFEGIEQVTRIDVAARVIRFAEIRSRGRRMPHQLKSKR